MTTLTSITISWTGAFNADGIVMEYQVQFTYNNSATNAKTTELMYKLEDLTPSTKVEFSVRAVSNCGQVGESSSTTEYTKSIRKSVCIMPLSYCQVLNYHDCMNCFVFSLDKFLQH